MNVLAMISPMSSERVQGIARYAREHGWNLLIQDRLGHRPLAWNGDGVIATIRNDPSTFKCIRALMRRGIPVIDLTISRPEVKVPRVISDHVEIGRLAARHFAEREFHHIAWFSTSWGNVHRLRYRGLVNCSAHRPYKWILSDELPARHQGNWCSFVKWIRGKLDQAPKPLAVLTYDETDAARLLAAAREIGISVPEELAILSIGNNPLVCENQSISLSSIDQNLERGGYEAARLLDKLLNHQPSASNLPRRADALVGAPTTILIPPAGIITRQSTDVIAVADPLVRKALEFIGQNLASPIGSPQIADSLGLKRHQLDRLFHEVLSRSVGEEIRRQRLARVKVLLKTSDLTIAEIAARTGYCTPSHLTNAFFNAFGQPPRSWRQNPVLSCFAPRANPKMVP